MIRYPTAYILIPLPLSMYHHTQDIIKCVTDNYVVLKTVKSEVEIHSVLHDISAAT